MSNYEPYLIEVDPDDGEFEESTLTSVDPYSDGKGWSVTRADGWSLGIPLLTLSRYGGAPPLWESPEPVVGDLIRVYGSFGRPFHGITLNGLVVFYRTPAMQEQHHRRFLEDSDARDARVATATAVEMDQAYAKLLPEFQKRVDGFRAKDPKFRRRGESYEVFCLLQAQAIADHYRPLGGVEALMSARGEGMDGFGNLWDELTKAGVVSDSHSNNTFGAAFAFARHLLDPAEASA